MKLPFKVESMGFCREVQMDYFTSLSPRASNGNRKAQENAKRIRSCCTAKMYAEIHAPTIMMAEKIADAIRGRQLPPSSAEWVQPTQAVPEV
jgi:hypothetical protein